MTAKTIKSNYYLENEYFVLNVSSRDTDFIGFIKNKTKQPFKIIAGERSLIVPARNWVGILPNKDGVFFLTAMKTNRYKIEDAEQIYKGPQGPNKYEQLFNDMLSMLDFTLIKNENDYNEKTDECGIWSLEDDMCCNYGDIEGDRFNSALGIIDRLDMYLNDLLIADMEDEFDVDTSVYSSWGEMVEKRADFPEGCQWHLDIMDMICNHANEIDLNNCKFEEKKEIKPSLKSRINSITNNKSENHLNMSQKFIEEYRI